MVQGNYKSLGDSKNVDVTWTYCEQSIETSLASVYALGIRLEHSHSFPRMFLLPITIYA